VSFLEIESLVFIPIVWVIHWLMPRRAGWQNTWLLLASCLFYAGWNWRFLPLLWTATLVDYAVARYLDAVPADPGGRARRRLALGLSLASAFGSLVCFKYMGFFAESMQALLAAAGLEASLPALRIVLPLGISFYTLQRVGYILDVYYERLPACRSIVAFALFVGYFPQITAGPISRGSQLLPQLAAPRRLTAALFGSAIGTFLLGYLLKGSVADWLGGRIVDPVFADPDAYSAATHWVALAAYALQVFADFAGYSLLAIGASRAFGIELPVNFNAPFLSRSMQEFWGRWHITLNRWLFDYIYGPLITSHGWFRGRLDLGLLIVFLASGLWHGPAWGFVIWGLLHGLGLVAHRNWDEFYRGLCRRDRAWVARRRSIPYALAAWAVTQAFFAATMLPFRAQSFAGTMSYLAGMVRPTAGAGGLDLGPAILAITWVGILLIAAGHAIQAPALHGVRERLERLPAPLVGVAAGAAILWLAIVMPASSGTFIYRAF